MVVSVVPAYSTSQPTARTPAIRNAVLFYDDYPTSGDPESQVTPAIARPLVAHLDQRAAPTDWMFDSFIFYNYWLYHTNKPTQSYIDTWIDYLFDGAQVANLDATVGEAKASLNQPAYEMNIFLTIPVPFDSVNASAILNNLDKLLDRWTAYGPHNLRLAGFYWGFTESLGDLPGLESIVPIIAEYVHSKGYKLLMIPYRNAGQVEKLHALGFDYVTMQPNYMQDPSSDRSDFAMVNNAIISGFVDGAELELSMTKSEVLCCNRDWKVNIATYLQSALQYGWNRAVLQTYYYGSDISKMARSSDPTYRAEYENIYQYIVHTRDTLMVLRRSSQTATIKTGVESQVVLLLGMDGSGGSTKFLDRSASNHAMTAQGNMQVDTAQSKFGGASAVFDGAGSYFSTPDSADWHFGTGEFTIDTWIRFNALPSVQGYEMFMGQFTDWNNRWFLGVSYDGTYYWWWFGAASGGKVLFAFCWSIFIPATGVWYHVALVRSGNSFNLYQDGISRGAPGTSGNEFPDIAAPLCVGASDPSGQVPTLNGWLQETRITKGLALWSSNFNPPNVSQLPITTT